MAAKSRIFRGVGLSTHEFLILLAFLATIILFWWLKEKSSKSSNKKSQKAVKFNESIMDNQTKENTIKNAKHP